ncbi:hypothetical protein Tco_1088307 [Tanacetum coccineum]
MHRLRGGMSMIENLMQKLLLLVQKLMILLLKLKCTSEGVQQRQKIKKKGRGFPEQKVLKSRCQTAEQKLSSWDKKHRKYRNERDALAIEKVKIKEELIETKLQLEHRERQVGEIQGRIASFFQSDFTLLVRKFLKSGEFNRAFAGVLNMTISVGVECRLHMDRTDEEFRELSQRVFGFVPDAKEKFDRVVAAFPNTTFPFLDKVSQSSQSSLQDIARLEPDKLLTGEYLLCAKEKVFPLPLLQSQLAGGLLSLTANGISFTIGDKLVGVTLFAWRQRAIRRCIVTL